MARNRTLVLAASDAPIFHEKLLVLIDSDEMLVVDVASIWRNTRGAAFHVHPALDQ